MKKVVLRNAVLISGSLLLTARAEALSRLSSFGQTPETISLAPNGNYIIPDFAGGGYGSVLQAPATGGSAGLYAANPGTVSLEGGLFLPSNFGASAGLYATFGGNETYNSSYGAFFGEVDTYSGGKSTAFATTTNFTNEQVTLDQPVVATSFGAYSGDVLVSTQERNLSTGNSASHLLALAPSGKFSTVATLPFNTTATGITTGGFGIAMVPSGFGAFGGDVMVSDSGSGSIVAITPSGSELAFATIPLLTGETGLRQLNFSPSGFLPGQGADLIVSVAGSEQGGGTFGELLALNPAGTIVDSIDQGKLTAPFDPRGTYFASSGQLVIADTDPGIDSASSADFTAGRSIPAAVPEPTCLAAFALGASSLLLGRSRRAIGK